MGSHLIDNEFQSDKYPTCPRGKVPLSVRDPMAQEFLWAYAYRRQVVDREFSDDLRAALIAAGYVPNPAKISGGLALPIDERRAVCVWQLSTGGVQIEGWTDFQMRGMALTREAMEAVVAIWAILKGGASDYWLAADDDEQGRGT